MNSLPKTRTCVNSPYTIDIADIVAWCESYTGPPFHAALMDTPYNLDSIRKRFGKPDSAPAKGDVYNRSARGFMNQDWDTDISFQPETWYQIGRHLHPGGFILAAGGSRSSHRAATAMEDAGLIVHPAFYLYYSFGSGFPKATRVKDNGAELEDFDGYRYGLQAIKPAVEPIICAQRPYEGRPVDNIAATGAGVWNVDGGRVEASNTDDYGRSAARSDGTRSGSGFFTGLDDDESYQTNDKGRWPAHFILQHNPDCRYTAAGWQCGDGCAVARLGEMSGESASNARPNLDGNLYDKNNIIYGQYNPVGYAKPHDDTGTAARFFFQSHWSYDIYERLNHADSVFYTSKPGVREREAGLGGLMKLRDDLTDEERQYVMSELERLGVD